MNLNEFTPQDGAYNNIKNEITKPPKLSPVKGAILTAVCVILAVLYGGTASGVIPPETLGAVFILIGLAAMFGYLLVSGSLYQPVMVVIAAIVAPAAFMYLFPSDESAAIVSFGAITFEALVPIACGFALFLSYKYRMRRTSGIVFASVLAGILFTGSILCGIYVSYGKISGDTVMNLIEEVRSTMIETINQVTEEMSKNISSLGDISSKLPAGSFNAESLVNSVFNILPAILIVTLTTLSYFMQKVFFFCFRVFGGGGKYLTSEMTTFEVSAPTAVIFAVCYVVSIFFMSQKGTAKAVLDNLTMILEPGLAITGIVSFLPKRQGNVVRIGCLPILAIIILFFITPGTATLVLAISGTFSVLKKAFGKQRKG